MSTQVGQDLGKYFDWRASDGFSIHLSLKLVTQLNAQISRVAENQSGELRGLLLGRTIDTPMPATMIDEFELISPPEYATAEQPDSDDKLFEIACRMAKDRNRQALGFFIFGWDSKLSMSRNLHDIFSRIFGENGNVALLIQRSRRGNDSDAALFYWQDGAAHPRDFGFGFPFDAGQLLSGHPGWRYPNPLDAPPAPRQPRPKAQAPERTAAPESEQAWAEFLKSPPVVYSESKSSIRWSHLAPTIVLAVIGIGALQLATSSKHTVAAAPPAEQTAVSETANVSIPPAPAVAAPAVPVNETVLGLTVTSAPQQLDIRWNRQSAAIVQAQTGVMKITEGGNTRIVPFDQRQLQDGYLAYLPKTNDVRVELDVTAKDGSPASEAVRWLAAR